MAIGAVGGVNGYSSTSFEGRRKDWRCDAKPLWMQEQERAEKRHKRGKKLLGLAIAAGLAFIFRGKIKQGYQLVKPYIAKVTTPVKNFLKTKTPKLADMLSKAKNTVVDVGNTVVKFVTEKGGKLIDKVKGIFKKP